MLLIPPINRTTRPERFPLVIGTIAGVFRPMLGTPPVIVIVIAVARRPLEELVELAAIESHAPALRTEVNFNSLAVSDHQIDLALRALHADDTHVRCEWRRPFLGARLARAVQVLLLTQHHGTEHVLGCSSNSARVFPKRGRSRPSAAVQYVNK
jgi:hypothetical protein